MKLAPDTNLISVVEYEGHKICQQGLGHHAHLELRRILVHDVRRLKLMQRPDHSSSMA